MLGEFENTIYLAVVNITISRAKIRKKIEILSPTLSEGEGVKTRLKHNNIEKCKTLSES